MPPTTRNAPGISYQWLGIEPHLREVGTEHGSEMGVFRCVVEHTSGRFRNSRRLRTRYDRRAGIQEGFLTCAKSLICFDFLFT